jgi:ankyrin repeat protein
MNGAQEVVRLLLEHGADVEVENSNGKTALQVAGGTRRDEIMKLLQEHGAK